ncbi:MAG: response regulator [Magnetococcus sp. YQC-3]
MNNQEAAPLKTILIVDDVVENLDILNNILGSRYQIKVATNGRVAIKIALSSHPPDIILLDVMMPVLDGYEVCQILKQDDRTRDIPILFVTSKAEEEDASKGFEVGAADYLLKPVSQSIVLARIKTHLALHDQRKLLDDRSKSVRPSLYSVILNLKRLVGKRFKNKKNDGINTERQ